MHAVDGADAADRALVERLWLLFRHDMTEFNGGLPNPDGTFRSEWLVSALEDENWAAHLAFAGDRPVGFAFVRAAGRLWDAVCAICAGGASRSVGNRVPGGERQGRAVLAAAGAGDRSGRVA
jgi:hypothetical protein